MLRSAFPLRKTKREVVQRYSKGVSLGVQEGNSGYSDDTSSEL